MEARESSGPENDQQRQAVARLKCCKCQSVANDTYTYQLVLLNASGTVCATQVDFRPKEWGRMRDGGGRGGTKSHNPWQGYSGQIVQTRLFAESRGASALSKGRG